mmetsp:Transcript_47126/g.120222  ORF Transcript_47126/g.120222 Transcript_47126/m.120222 type:complete len:174 (+) Transcript_47126:100-621(+)
MPTVKGSREGGHKPGAPAVALAVLLLCGSHAVLAGAAGDIAVDTSNFDAVVADEQVWVVKFHSPRCGTCQEFAPVWRQFAAAEGDRASFGVVDIDTKPGMDLAKRLNALEDGVPSVRVFKDPHSSTGTLLWADWQIPEASALMARLETELSGHVAGGRYVKVAGSGEAHAEDL